MGVSSSGHRTACLKQENNSSNLLAPTNNCFAHCINLENSMFNQFGNCTLPDEISEAKEVYFSIVKKYLDTMTILECRALLAYINMDLDLMEYILRRQINARKNIIQKTTILPTSSIL